MIEKALAILLHLDAWACAALGAYSLVTLDAPGAGLLFASGLLSWAIGGVLISRAARRAAR